MENYENVQKDFKSGRITVRYITVGNETKLL